MAQPKSFSDQAHVAALNPEGLAEVSVDLSGVLLRGQAFRIVSVKNFFGPPLVAGVYKADPVTLPMKPVTPPSPVGMLTAKLPITEPHFGAFVVLPEPPPGQ